MSIADTINSIKQNLQNAYTSLETKGATITGSKNIENLPIAINSIGNPVEDNIQVPSDIDTITKMQQNIIRAYNILEAKGATIPANKNLANISEAINTIPVSTIQEINYELSYNQLAQYVQGEHRVVYGGDCADWEPATMDVNGTGTISDPSGILNKWPFNLIKPCLVHNGTILGYLNPNDYSLFEDGSVADITNEAYDVMVEFPKIYYKLEEDWDGVAVWNQCTKANLSISISNKPKDGYVCLAHMRQGKEYDSILVAAYENFVDNKNKLLTCSGLKADNYSSHGYILKHFDEYKDSQYGTFHIHIATMLQILSLLLFKEYEGSYTYGNGYKGDKTNPTLKQTGVCNSKGMFYGLYSGSNNSADNYSNKLFGLENILGHCFVVLDGLLTTNDLHYLIYDPTLPESKINYDGEGYVEYAPTVSALSGYLVRLSANNNYGFLPVSHVPAASYSKNYYYCVNTLKRPSQYNNVDLTSEYVSQYMIYNYGGSYENPYQSLFSYVAMNEISDKIHNAERLICYPINKKSS